MVKREPPDVILPERLSQNHWLTCIRAKESNVSMRFSKRTKWDTEESNLARAQRERQSTGAPTIDLTASNPTRCRFDYPTDLLIPLMDLAALDYEPDPKGSIGARDAVCRYYKDQGSLIDPNSILLTASTSEAYGYLFKLLCNPGDLVLVPQPSYPLFDFLARAEAVELASAPLVYDHGWQLDLAELRRAITARTRAIVLVHPNNPTGHFTKAEEARELAAICREHRLALIVDEVFLDYGFERTSTEPAEDRMTFAARELDILVFIVSGISKICALPQMKVAWLVAIGPGAEEALTRLEVVADTYLSMNAPMQRALPVWLGERAAIQIQIRDRIRTNLIELDAALTRQAQGQTSGALVNRLRVEGGWYAVLRIPATQPDELTALELLDVGVLVHPGYFFGMSESGWLVVSLLTETSDFSRGISELLGYLDRNHECYL
jgi:alanine-synthesizing transaminase